MELQRCAGCGAFRYPPGPVCPACLDERWEWTPVAGEGIVYVALTCVRPPHPAWADDVPYNVSLIDLPEGVRMWGNVVGGAPDEIRIGDTVTLRYEDVAPEVSLPRWEIRRRG